MIVFQDYSCYYEVKGGFLAALDKVSFTINDGEMLVLVGESGSGKTSFLKSILHLIDNMSGSLTIDEIPVQKVNYRNNLFAYVNQQYVLFPRMTIYENIAYPLRVMHTKQDEVDRRVRSLAEELGILHLLTRKPKQLSGGQQQRVAIARALIKHPKYLLMDEPFSNVEPAMRDDLRQMVRDIHKDYDTTVIFVTHDLSEAFSLADRIAVLKDGKLIETGTPLELRTHAKSDLIRQYLSL